MRELFVVSLFIVERLKINPTHFAMSIFVDIQRHISRALLNKHYRRLDKDIKMKIPPRNKNLVIILGNYYTLSLNEMS